MSKLLQAADMLRTAIEEIADQVETGKVPNQGLCELVRGRLPAGPALDLMDRLIEIWPEGSDSAIYPVPDWNGGSPRAAFWRAKLDGGLWALGTSYSSARRQLLAHIRMRLVGLNASPEIRATLAQVLKRIQHGIDAGTARSHIGLCELTTGTALRGFCDHEGARDCQVLLSAMMRLWPEYSGDPQYPVPAPDGTTKPEEAFDDTYDLWDRASPYGAARRRLLNWLIERFEEVADAVL